jgi:amino acid transporter
MIMTIIATIMAVPTVTVFTYIFNMTDYVSVTNILYISLAFTIIIFGASFLFTILTRDKLRRRLKASYQREFTFISALSALGVLGSGILFMYLGGDEFYVLHVIIPLGLITYTIIYIVGDRFFNVRFIRR